MNIFATDSDPQRSALWLDDIRKNKMIVESAQLLSTTIRILDPKAEDRTDIYKIFSKNHPCGKWARLSAGNYDWLLEHALALCWQRSKNNHKTYPILKACKEWRQDANTSEFFPSREKTSFVNAAANKEKGVCFKHVKDTNEAYRRYLSSRWQADTIPLTRS